MMRLLAAVIFTSSLVPGAPSGTIAWSADGHRLICAIAWQELTPTARRRVTALLARDTAYSTFADACVWPDEIRRDARYRRYVTAHYVNLPPGAAGFRLERDCSEYCVVQAIRDLTRVLGNAGADPQHRLEALKFIGHFVGDIHQPLHAGYGSDRGGNGVTVRFAGREVTLHWLWDGVLLDAMGLGPAAADSLRANVHPMDRAAWHDLDPAVWANESYQLVENQVYRGISPGGPVDRTYLERNRYTVEQQIEKAGIRLGALLNRLLGT